MKPIVVVTWPINIDYPVFRWNLERFKDYFAGIWIGLSNHHKEVDISNFIRDKLPFCNFVEVSHLTGDWRNSAVNQVLAKIKTQEPILFLEQDFLIADNSFFDKVLNHNADIIYFKEGDRVHPAFALVKREIINNTSQDFSVSPPGDHFYKFFKEAFSIADTSLNIKDLQVVEKTDYYHMAGTTQNYCNFEYNEPFFHGINFLMYNYKSMIIPGQHVSWYQKETQIENIYGHAKNHTFLNNFFPK